MIGLELAGQTSRLFPTGDGTDAYPKARSPWTVAAPNVSGVADPSELAGQPRCSALIAESPHLDRKAALIRRQGQEALLEMLERETNPVIRYRRL